MAYNKHVELHMETSNKPLFYTDGVKGGLLTGAAFEAGFFVWSKIQAAAPNIDKVAAIAADTRANTAAGVGVITLGLLGLSVIGDAINSRRHN